MSLGHCRIYTLIRVQRTQYVNAQNTFSQLFDMGVIPIVNENDTLAVSVCLRPQLIDSIYVPNRICSRKLNSVITTHCLPLQRLW